MNEPDSEVPFVWNGTFNLLSLGVTYLNLPGLLPGIWVRYPMPALNGAMAGLLADAQPPFWHFRASHVASGSTLRYT